MTYYFPFYLHFSQPKDVMEKILSEYNRFDDNSDGVDGPLYEAIEILQSNFLNNKEVNHLFKSVSMKMAPGHIFLVY